jgi:Ca2+-binding RTX toxin-like protein
VSNSYTFQILDPNNLVSAAIEASIAVDAQYVIGLVSRYVSWKGTMDFVVEIRSAAELTWSDVDGLLPSVVQTAWNGSAWVNQTLIEAKTGIDLDPNRPDAGLTIYLGDDGTIRNYGAPVWFDPNPGFEAQAAVPAGSHDFVSILTHEIVHSLGFIHYTQEWAARITTAGDVSYFTGPQASFLYGGAIPFRTGSDHYGYAQDPSVPIERGLMYQYGNYELNRWEIGRIDLAVLADLGYAIKSYDGLALFELLDSSTDLIGTEAGEMLYGDYHSNLLSGLGGNDRIEAGSGNDQLSGGDGNDLLRGGAGVDSFDGGANTTADDPVTVYGDRISFAEPTATQGAVADLRTGIISNDGFGNVETMTGIESLGGGTAFADVLHGNDDRNALLGSRGDTLAGHGGDDIIRITAAPAQADGGSGADLLELSSNGGFLLPDSDGDGLAETGGAMPGAWVVDLDTGLIADGYGNAGTVAGIENVSGSSASDTIGGDDNANIISGNGGVDYLFGAGGGDTLDGGDGNDEMDGGDGSDMLRGQAGDDQLHVSGAGMDMVEGGAGTDMLIVDYGDTAFAVTASAPQADPNGGRMGSIGDGTTRAVSYSGIENFNITTGSGDDRVRGGSGDNYVYLGAGNDEYVVAGGFNSIDGGDGTDGIWANFGAMTGGVSWSLVTGTHNLVANYLNFEYFAELVTGSGQDIVTTANNGRSDKVILGAGSDSVVLWDGMDTVNGGAADSGSTDGGFDILILNYGQATTGVHNIGALTSDAAGYSGGFGDDSTRMAIFQAFDRFLIATGSGADNITTGAGNDDVRTAGGNDIVDSGAGNDLIDGGGGDDLMTGGTGNDIYVVSSAGDTVVEYAGEGIDLVRTALAAYTLAANVENLTATTDAAHDFRGNGLNNVITGGAGNDVFRLQDGGDDTALGGVGNDFFLALGALTSGDSITGGAGSDEIALQGDYSAGVTLGAIAEVELLVLLPGNDTRFGAPGTASYSYRIATGNQNVAPGGLLNVDANRLRAGENLVFDGSAETDGSFYIFAGKGVDTLTGGSQNDAFLFRGPGNFTAADTVSGGAGFDELALRGDYTGAYKVAFGASTISSIEAIVVISGHDLRYGREAGDYSFDIKLHDANVQPGQVVIVDAGTLRSGEKLAFDGSAELDGGRFTMFGGKGADVLTGGSGADSIRGGLGADVMTGNGGADTFVFRDTAESAPGTPDKILDFVSGADRIDLARIDANSLADGNQAFNWIGSEAFGGLGAETAGELRAYQSGSDWFVEGDTDGDGLADFVLQVTGPALVQGDFLP